MTDLVPVGNIFGERVRIKNSTSRHRKLGPPDRYPQDKDQAEDRLSTHYLKHGFDVKNQNLVSVGQEIGSATDQFCKLFAGTGILDGRLNLELLHVFDSFDLIEIQFLYNFPICENPKIPLFPQNPLISPKSPHFP